MALKEKVNEPNPAVLNSTLRSTRLLNAVTTYLLLTVWGLIAAMPMVWMISSAFKPTREIYSWPPSLIPTSPTLSNFYEAWTRVPFARFLLNSMFISIGEIVFGVVIAALVGYAITMRRFPGRNIVWLTVLSGLIIPDQVLYIPRFMLIRQFEWINTYQGILSPYLVSTIGIFLLAQFFQNIPADLIDAARVDGMGEFSILWRIVLPLSRPALATLSIFIWLSSWTNFFWPLLVVVSEDMRPLPLGLASFFQEEGVADFGNVLAANTMAIIPPLLIFLMFQRYFVQGISFSGLKDV